MSTKRKIKFNEILNHLVTLTCDECINEFPPKGVEI